MTDHAPSLVFNVSDTLVYDQIPGKLLHTAQDDGNVLRHTNSSI